MWGAILFSISKTNNPMCVSSLFWPSKVHFEVKIDSFLAFMKLNYRISSLRPTSIIFCRVFNCGHYQKCRYYLREGLIRENTVFSATQQRTETLILYLFCPWKYEHHQKRDTYFSKMAKKSIPNVTLTPHDGRWH